MPLNLGFVGVDSMKAVNDWVGILNANMNGTAKQGFKSMRVHFEGGSPIVYSPPANGLLAFQTPDLTLKVAHSPIDFSQGQITPSSQNTHFAIIDRPTAVGTNFFVVREPFSTAGANDANTDNYKYFLTRDGEFHWAPAVITTHTQEIQTLQVTLPTGAPGSGTYNLTFDGQTTVTLNDQSTAGQIQTALENLPNIGAGNVAVSGPVAGKFSIAFQNALAGQNVPELQGQVVGNNNAVQFSLQASQEMVEVNQLSASTPNGFVLVNNYNLVVISRLGSPVYSTTGAFGAGTGATDAATDAEKPLVYNYKAPALLQFSKYGGSIFDYTSLAPVNRNSFRPGDDASQDARAAGNYQADRVQSSLESSNASVTTLIPELTIAQKTFSGLAKLLTVFTQNLDNSMGTIKG